MSTELERGVLYNTTDYSIFKTMEGNRSLSPANIKNLERSIKENNLLYANPIIVNDDMEVVDGQHRLTVAKKLGLTVFYIVAEAGIHDVRQMNTNMEKWQVMDWIKSHAVHNPDYKTVLDFINKHQISATLGVRLFQRLPNDRDGRARGAQQFRNGTMEIRPVDQVEAFFDVMVAHSQHVGKIAFTNPYISALRHLYTKRGIDHERLMENFEKSSYKVVKRPNMRLYLRDLEEIYNFRLRVRDSFFDNE